MCSHVEIRPSDQNGFVVRCGELEVWFARVTNAKKFAEGLADDGPVVLLNADGTVAEAYSATTSLALRIAEKVRTAA
jgi:hypothetical protein